MRKPQARMIAQEMSSRPSVRKAVARRGPRFRFEWCVRVSYLDPWGRLKNRLVYRA